MKKNVADDFYIKICIWTFLCFILAAVCDQIKPVVAGVFRSDNEVCATQSIQTIRTLQAQYASKNQGKFAPNFDELVKKVWLDEKFGGQNPVVNGYTFTMLAEKPTETKAAFYSINADPQLASGYIRFPQRHFYYDSIINSIKAT